MFLNPLSKSTEFFLSQMLNIIIWNSEHSADIWPSADNTHLIIELYTKIGKTT